MKYLLCITVSINFINFRERTIWQWFNLPKAKNKSDGTYFLYTKNVHKTVPKVVTEIVPKIVHWIVPKIVHWIVPEIVHDLCIAN